MAESEKDASRLARRQGWCSAEGHLEDAELVHVVLPDDVGAAGQHLARLDEGRPQRRQRLPAMPNPILTSEKTATTGALDICLSGS